MQIYRIIEKLISEGRSAFMVTAFDRESGCPHKEKMILTADGEIIFNSYDCEQAEEIKKFSLDYVCKGQSLLTQMFPGGEREQEIFINAFIPQPRLIIMGGGHVGAALCRLADELDYQVTVIDDRPSFASRENHPKADRLICDQFDRAIDQVNPSPSDFLVIVTRGHRHDRLCLEKVLQTEAAYIGMIGSRSRVKAQLQDLSEAGYPEKVLTRIYSPIGLAIGAVTETEIALSILAEITRVRRSISRGETVQREVLKALCRLEEEGHEALLATIIDVKGSAPRKTGSQMVVLPGGSLIGTIGGGCAEADVRRQALLCLDNGNPGRLRLGLNADTLADEGMACGGVMDISLELLPVIE